MAKPFRNLVEKMSPESRARMQVRTQEALLALNLQELRQQLTALTQEDIASLLRVTQPLISKIERRGDLHLSTLYAYIQALGGEVEIRVKLPGKEEVRLNQFESAARVLGEQGRDSIPTP